MMDNQITILLLGLITMGLILATSWIEDARRYFEEEIEQMKRTEIQGGKDEKGSN